MAKRQKKLLYAEMDKSPLRLDKRQSQAEVLDSISMNSIENID